MDGRSHYSNREYTEKRPAIYDVFARAKNELARRGHKPRNFEKVLLTVDGGPHYAQRSRCAHCGMTALLKGDFDLTGRMMEEACDGRYHERTRAEIAGRVI